MRELSGPRSPVGPVGPPAGRAVIGPRLDSAAVGLCWRLSVWS